MPNPQRYGNEPGRLTVPRGLRRVGAKSKVASVVSDSVNAPTAAATATAATATPVNTTLPSVP